MIHHLPRLKLVPDGDGELLRLLGRVDQVPKAPVLVAVIDLRTNKDNGDNGSKERPNKG